MAEPLQAKIAGREEADHVDFGAQSQSDGHHPQYRIGIAGEQGDASNRRREESRSHIGCEKLVHEIAGQDPARHTRDSRCNQDFGRGAWRPSTFDEERHHVHDASIDYDGHEKDCQSDAPERAQPHGFAQGHAGRQFASRATRRTIVDRLSDQEEDRRQCHCHDRYAQPNIGHAPAERSDQPVCVLRNERRADADAAHGDADGESATPIEVARDGFDIADRALRGARGTGERRQHDEHRERGALTDDRDIERKQADGDRHRSPNAELVH